MIAAHDPEFRHAGVCAIPTRQATEEHDQPQVLLNNDAADDDSPTLPPSSLSSSSGFLSSQWVVDPSADIAAAKACVRKRIYDLDGLSSLIRYSGSRYHDQEVEAFAGMDELDNNMTSQSSNVAALIVNRKYPQADESLRNRLSESIFGGGTESLALERTMRRHRLPVSHVNKRLALDREDRKFLHGKAEAVLHPKHQQVTPKSRDPTHLHRISASEIVPEPLRPQESPFPSQVFTSTSDSSPQIAGFDFLPVPKVDSNGMFECPYCYILCPVKKSNGKHWR